MKKGLLSEVEICFIESKKDVMSAEEIAQKLDRTVNTVKKHIAANLKKAAENLEKQIEENAANSAKEQEAAAVKAVDTQSSPIIKFDQLMGRKRETVIMTPAASQLSDDLRKINKANKTDTSCLHTIKKGV